MTYQSILIFLIMVLPLLSQESRTIDEYLSALPSSESSVFALNEALEKGDDGVKVKAIGALSKISSKEAFKIFAKYIGYGRTIKTVNLPESMDRTWEIRRSSAMGFANMKDPESSKNLIESILVEDNLSVLKAIVYALGELKDISSVPALIRTLETSTDEALIIQCVQTLGKIGDKSCFRPLLRISTGKHLSITKREAIKALEKIKW